MKLHIDWLKEAKYSSNYITDGILFIHRSFVYIPEDFGYRKMNPLWEDTLDKTFNLQPVKRIEKNLNCISRTYARTTITRYDILNSINSKEVNQYVILNDEYRYLWSHWDTVLCTLQNCNSIQYNGIVGIYENCILVGILTPIIIEDKNLFSDSYWKDIDKQIGLGRVVTV